METGSIAAARYFLIVWEAGIRTFSLHLWCVRLGESGSKERTVIGSINNFHPTPPRSKDNFLCRACSRDAQGVAHYDSRSDCAFTSSLSCRTISVALRTSASLKDTLMVEAITSNLAFSSR